MEPVNYDGEELHRACSRSKALAAMKAVSQPTAKPDDINWKAEWEATTMLHIGLATAAKAFEVAMTADIPVGDGYQKWVENAQKARADLMSALAARPGADLLEKQMVERFLRWKLPADFDPDDGISFKPMFNEHTDHPMRHEPTGTNLLNYDQALAMVRYIVREGEP